MYNVDAAAFFMEKFVLGTCMSDSEVILDFIEAMLLSLALMKRFLPCLIAKK